MKFDEMSLKKLLSLESEMRKPADKYHIALASKYFAQGNIADASSSAARAIESNPSCVDAYRVLAQIQENSGDVEGALDLRRKVRDLSPSVDSNIELITYLYDNNLLTEAVDEVRKALGQYPNALPLVHMQCIVLSDTPNQDDSEVLSAYRHLIEISGNNPLYQYEFGSWLRTVRREDEAKAVFASIIDSPALPDELRQNVKRYMSEQETERRGFRAAARLLIQLGEQMIENEYVALSELIKNSYDARSETVDITVDTEYRQFDREIGKLVIEDTGLGMTKDVVEQYWLFISTSYKEHMKRNASLEHVPLGEKGIGRLSAHRLGQKLVLETSACGEPYKTYVELDWEKFERQSDADLNSVTMILSTVPENRDAHYTRLIITKLKNPDFWIQLRSNSQKQSKLRQELFSMLSPFKELRTAFSVSIDVNDAKIPMHTIDEEFLKLICSLELNFTFGQTIRNEWMAHSEVAFSRSFFEQRTAKYISELSKYGSEWVERYHELAQMPTETVVKKRDWNQERLLQELRGVWEVQAFGFQSPGPFEMKVYGFSRGDDTTRDRVEQELANLYVSEGSKQRTRAKEYFDAISGIKIYRDGFRIFPYGDSRNDWLDLNVSATSSGKYDDLKTNNTTGYVKLTGKNYHLKEKTNREGFISDVYSTVFFEISRLSIRHANDEIQTMLRHYRRIYNELLQQIREHEEREKEQFALQTNDAEARLRAASESHNPEVRSLAAVMSDYARSSQKTAMVATRELGVVQEQYDQLLEDTQVILELASLGMLVETFTHEYALASTKVGTYLRDLKAIIDRTPQSRKLMSQMEQTISQIDDYIHYLSPSYQGRTKRRTKLDLARILYEMYGSESSSFLVNRAHRNGIQTIVTGSDKFVILGNKGLITQIFDNLYINSEYWLNVDRELRYIDQQEFHIHLSEENRCIAVWDTGRGIDPTIETTLFDAFKSTKPGEGRGLGLYITKTLSQTLHIDISLSPERNDFNRRYKFILDFSKNEGN